MITLEADVSSVIPTAQMILQLAQKHGRYSFASRALRSLLDSSTLPKDECAKVTFFYHLAEHWQAVANSNMVAAMSHEKRLALYASDVCDHLSSMLCVAERLFVSNEIEACLQQCRSIERQMKDNISAQHIKAYLVQQPLIKADVAALTARCYLRLNNAELASALLSQAAFAALESHLIGAYVHVQVVFMQCLLNLHRYSLFSKIEPEIFAIADVHGSFVDVAELTLMRGYFSCVYLKDFKAAETLLLRSCGMFIRMGDNLNQKRCLHLLDFCDSRID
eukprot:gene4018-8424_t